MPGADFFLIYKSVRVPAHCEHRALYYFLQDVADVLRRGFATAGVSLPHPIHLRRELSS